MLANSISKSTRKRQHQSDQSDTLIFLPADQLRNREHEAAGLIATFRQAFDAAFQDAHDALPKMRERNPWASPGELMQAVYRYARATALTAISETALDTVDAMRKSVSTAEGVAA